MPPKVSALSSFACWMVQRLHHGDGTFAGRIADRMEDGLQIFAVAFGRVFVEIGGVPILRQLQPLP